MTFYTRFEKPPRQRLAFNPELGNPSHPDNSRTRQEFKDECDINKIIAKAVRNGGLVTSGNFRDPSAMQSGDFAALAEIDYQAVNNQRIEAEKAFLSLPSEVRDYYRNSPHRFLEAVKSPSDFDKTLLRKHGILKAEVIPTEPEPVSAGGNISGESES